jgi:hypothetical protein
LISKHAVTLYRRSNPFLLFVSVKNRKSLTKFSQASKEENALLGSPISHWRGFGAIHESASVERSSALEGEGGAYPGQSGRVMSAGPTHALQNLIKRASCKSMGVNGDKKRVIRLK